MPRIDGDPSRRRRSAFTLMELLVVLAIIAVLIGLLVPAVQRVREAANRVHCSSNLKNIGLALNQFETTYGKFPPSRIYPGPLPEAGVTAAVIHSWGVFILPFIEQTALAQKYNWNLDFFDPANQPVASTQLKILQCPSAQSDRFMIFDFFSYGKAACTDYSPTEEVAQVLAQRHWIDPLGNYRGVMARNSMTRLRDITDGTSNTILQAEDSGRPRQWRVGQPGPDQVLFGCPWVGAGNPIVLTGATPDGRITLGPCALNCSNDQEIYSFHPGGANTVFADGSVHFLKTGIDIRLLARLVTRAGGEVLSGDEY
jgi:prepilin-type N-terminal cleavage/methylation domain-containing protein/prepilin-type processing-associated H-X9-DG protein